MAQPNAGGIWEGLVIQQVQSVLKSDIDKCIYRTSHCAEIDLVLTLPSQKRIGVEIKLSAKPSLTRGNYEAMQDLKLEKLYVLIPSQDRYSLKKNVMVMGIGDFLEEN